LPDPSDPRLSPAPSAAAPAPEADPARAIRLLPLLATGAFASQASMRVVDPMLPELARDFGTGITELSGAITAFAVAYGLMQLVYGPMADRLGKLRVITWATMAACVLSGACALATGPTSLAVLRLLSGAACAGLIPVSLAWIGDNVPYQRRQLTLARFMIGSTLGVVVGQIAGGVFADTLGWRMSFLAQSVVFLGVALALARVLRRGQADAPAPGSQAGGNPLRAFGAVLGDPWARVILALVLVEGAFNFGTLALLPSWLHEAHGLALWQTGMAAAGYGAGGLTVALLGRWLVARLGERGMALVGAAVLCAGMLSTGGPHWMLESLKCAITGAGFFMMHNTLQTVATQMVPSQRGTAISAFALSLFIGQSAGVAVVARLGQSIGFERVKTVNGLGLLALGLVLTALLQRRARA